MRLCVAILMVALFAVSASAADMIPAVGYGSITQKGSHPETGYYIGFGVPIVQKVEAGFVFKNENSYLYSNRVTEEVQVLRVLAVAEKSIVQRFKGTSPTPYFRWYVGLGSGTWSFIQSGEGEQNDEAFGVIHLRTGITYEGVYGLLAGDIVQVPGPDILGLFAGLGFDF